MSFEYIIARRYLRAKRRVGLVTIISLISVFGITIGVAALIVVLSVFNGFNSFAVDKIVGFDPHLRITPVSAPTVNADSLIATLHIPDLQEAAPFITGRTAIIHNNVTQVAEIRGVEEAHGTGASLQKTLPFEDDHPVILGYLLARKLGAGVGDEISFISRKGLELALTQVAQPVISTARMSGTFTMNQEYDEHVAFVTLEMARELFDLKEGEMGVEIRLNDFENAETLAPVLAAELGPDFRVETWQDLHRDLYGAMELERWAAFAILLLIIIVAVFNVLGSLTMTVIEKQRDIGVLKAMGASDGNILRIFLYEGGLIGLIGTTAGVILGTGLCLLQTSYGLFKLDTNNYLLPAVPVEMRLLDILLVSVTALVLALCAALYPARRAAATKPAEAIRWE